MGCWNGTCGVTSLPITVGNAVEAFIIYDPHASYRSIMNKKEQSDAPDLTNFSYAHGICRPVGPAMKAEYNDYGAVENIEEDACSDIIKKFLQGQDLKFAREHDIKHYAPKGLDKLSLEDLIRVVERGMIPGLGLMLVHEFAYKQLIDENRGILRNYFLKTFENSLKKRAESDGEMLWSLDVHTEVIDKTLFLLDIDFLKTDGVIDRLVEHQGFSSQFDGLRRHWGPRAGAGAQCTMFTEHRNLLKATLEHIEEREQELKKQYEEWGDEYDPEYF